MRAWIPMTLALLVAIAPPALAERNWEVSDATISLSLEAEHLANLGFTIAHARSSAPIEDRVLRTMGGASHAFEAQPISGAVFTSDRGRGVGFTERTEIAFQGGFSIATRHPATGEALDPAFLYDFVLVIDPSVERDPMTIHMAGDDQPLLRLRNAGFFIDENHGQLFVRMADLQVSEAWANALGQPYLTDQYVGMVDLRFSVSTNDPMDWDPEEAELELQRGTGQTAGLDVTLGQLYGITSQGHIGSYPNGTAGLSAATTSCNSGSVIVPWNSPMQETHPFIALALYRIDSDGTLTQLGHNWMKHGFFALSNDQCDLGCTPSNGTYLGIGCSDTYSSGHNGDRFYLGPREEVNPFTGDWEACGSWFDDGGVPDADCSRDYFGSAPNSVFGRLQVQDADLNNPGADYYYEGMYVVAGDTKPANTIGWRECSMSWSGSNWSFSTLGAGLTPEYGPFIETWGDLSKSQLVAADDGEAVVAVRVTDNGDGTWHYEYCVFNWLSWRGVRSFAVPVVGANITNIDFYDPDTDGSNDWTGSIQGGYVVWEVPNEATDPNANSIEYQRMYNFRFDADTPGVISDVTGKPYREAGLGADPEFVLSSYAPSLPPAVGVIGGVTQANDGLLLTTNEPNPFSASTRVSFTVPQDQAVTLSVHDIAGRTVRVLVDRVATAGSSEAIWDGRDGSGQEVASGVYFLRLATEEGSRTVKATLRR